ncbi:hypothetical protein K402DRAFT_453540, partial [Aulographum hederae CBS 113979]
RKTHETTTIRNQTSYPDQSNPQLPPPIYGLIALSSLQFLEILSPPCLHPWLHLLRNLLRLLFLLIPRLPLKQQHQPSQPSRPLCGAHRPRLPISRLELGSSALPITLPGRFKSPNKPTSLLHRWPPKDLLPHEPEPKVTQVECDHLSGSVQPSHDNEFAKKLDDGKARKRHWWRRGSAGEGGLSRALRKVSRGDYEDE